MANPLRRLIKGRFLKQAKRLLGASEALEAHDEEIAAREVTIETSKEQLIAKYFDALLEHLKFAGAGMDADEIDEKLAAVKTLCQTLHRAISETQLLAINELLADRRAMERNLDALVSSVPKSLDGSRDAVRDAVDTTLSKSQQDLQALRGLLGQQLTVLRTIESLAEEGRHAQVSERQLALMRKLYERLLVLLHAERSSLDRLKASPEAKGLFERLATWLDYLEHRLKQLDRARSLTPAATTH